MDQFCVQEIDELIFHSGDRWINFFVQEIDVNNQDKCHSVRGKRRVL